MYNYKANFRYKRPSEGEYNLTANFAPLGNYFIYFDGVEVDSEAIVGMTQSGQLFTDNFILGSTVCREVELKVLKSYIEEIPNLVAIKDTDNNIRFTLQVDNIDDTNINFYVLSLVDSMVNLNVVYDYSSLPVKTAQQILNALCEDLLDCDAPEIEWGGDIPLADNQGLQARDIVSYIAEINGGYARIDEEGVLEFVKFDNSNYTEIDVNLCKDITIGEFHKIDRVYIEYGAGTRYYPNPYSGNGNTLYLNPDNVLITDSGEYTVDEVIQHIYSLINGFEFYSIKTNLCQVYQDQFPGDMLLYKLNNETYPSIAQIDWDFNIKWNGGYNCTVETKKQEETRVDGFTEKMRKVNIKVDREIGLISQQVTDIEQTTNIVAADYVEKVDIEYAQSQDEQTVPTSWSTTAPTWDDELVMWQRVQVHYLDGKIITSNPLICHKEEGKTVSFIQELYYCSESSQEPDLPTSGITTYDEVYEQWTLICPTNNPPKSVYFVCTQLVYSNGTYSWDDFSYVGGTPGPAKTYNEITTLATNISEISQQADEIELTVAQIQDVDIAGLEQRTTTLETSVNITTDGVRISQGSLGDYVLVSDDGMDIFSEGNRVAYARNDGFYAIDYIMNGWHMITLNNNNSFCFIRKEYN